MRIPYKHIIMAVLYASGVRAQTLQDSLIAHFPMDGSPNNTVGSLVPVVTSGSPTFCADRFGNLNGAACFDGASFWSYGDVLDMDTSMFSISFWCRIDGITPNSTAHDYPIAKGTTAFGTPTLSGYAFGFRDELPDTLSAAVLWGQGSQPVLVQDQPITYALWNHFVMSRCTNDVVQMYVNGALVASDTLDLNASIMTNIYFSIGVADRAPANSPTGFFQGAVDDIRVYKGRCLSSAEIAVLTDLNVSIAALETSNQELRFSPNPATQTLRIDLTGSENITGPVLVLNAIGQTVPMANGSLGQTSLGVLSLTVDVSGLPNGAYFVVVPTEKGRSHGRFVKE